MPRRPDPGRIYLAQRTGMYRRLVDAERVDPDMATAWLDAWEVEALTRDLERGGHVFWDEGWRWIEAERAAKRKPR